MSTAHDEVLVSSASALAGIYRQGRVLVFNPMGIPIGQVLLAGRDEGRNLLSTNMALKPGTKALFIMTSDGDRGRPATIFHAGALAEALPLFSHR